MKDFKNCRMEDFCREENEIVKKLKKKRANYLRNPSTHPRYEKTMNKLSDRTDRRSRSALTDAESNFFMLPPLRVDSLLLISLHNIIGIAVNV